MKQDEREIEVKFYLSNVTAFRERLSAAGAERIQDRLLETNLRFDLPDGSLSRAHQVLRLRQDNRARLTFKGPAEPGVEVSDRTEIEFEVSDFTAARRLLESLGYQLIVMYEKWRTTYRLDPVEIVMDEMPYGNFCEIEGPDEAGIRQAAERLGLDWEARITASYTALFDLLRLKRQLNVTHLTFEEFSRLTVSAADLDVRPADHDSG